MRKLRNLIERALGRPSPPTEPIVSTFGADASRQATEAQRKRDWETVIAIEKGRTKRGMGG